MPVLSGHADVLLLLADVLGQVRGAAGLAGVVDLLVEVVDAGEHQGAALTVHPLEHDVGEDRRLVVTAGVVHACLLREIRSGAAIHLQGGD